MHEHGPSTKSLQTCGVPMCHVVLHGAISISLTAILKEKVEIYLSVTFEMQKMMLQKWCVALATALAIAYGTNISFHATLQSLRHSKTLVREPIWSELHKANDKECERLVERFTSEEAMKAVMEFFKDKGKL